ncbi:MAG: uncharacterized protein KVP18_001574 [Porospora cf. gigantea A]|uniref:uncharacterized protein n=1 Tax=Porospora cf. gigantea A TaxID=2853593 RepID=UPI003559EB2C|nr:MAG: hypothetical protein KVP18_001574 [Porospora cf. gigantea A]
MLCETMSGHCWKDVYHDNTVTWLSFYRDSINNSFKYVFLSPASAVKGQTDHAKYEKARKLQHFIKGIRRDYTSKMLNGDAVDRQLGLAVYVIDVLALRVGNEKDTDAEADTVGCCSLRKEHITTEDNNKVTLDFLGKDSIRYFNTVTIGDLAFKTLTGLLTNKKPETDVFDRISPTVVNRYLKGGAVTGQ